MPLRRPTLLTLSFTFLALAPPLYLSYVSTQVSSVPTSRISSSYSISTSLATSATARLVNPHGYFSTQDSRSTAVRLGDRVSDEQILARFMKGFFGEGMFAPERVVLSGLGRRINWFEGLKDEPITEHVWSTGYLRRNTLPPLHALFFGAFRVVDFQLDGLSPAVSDAAQETVVSSALPSLAPSTGYSYIDLAWGVEGGLLAGVHRFSVTRDVGVKNGEEKEGDVVITFECEANTKDWAGVLGGTLGTFHMWYAMWLFREGVAEVLKG